MEDVNDGVYCTPAVPEWNLWTVTYHCDSYKGIGLVKALTSDEATRLFLANSNFNGQAALKVDKVEVLDTFNESRNLLFEYYLDTILAI